MEINVTRAPRIKRRFPIEMRIRTYIVLPIYLFIVSVALFKTQQPGFALMVTGILALFFMVNHGMDWGYQFAYDETQMYQRPKGWRWFLRRLPWHVISYDDVSRMETTFGSDVELKRHYFPFEFIVLFGRSGMHGDNIVIYPPAFRDGSMKDFLRFLYRRRPEVFPNEVRAYMDSGEPL